MDSQETKVSKEPEPLLVTQKDQKLKTSKEERLGKGDTPPRKGEITPRIEVSPQRTEIDPKVETRFSPLRSKREADPLLLIISRKQEIRVNLLAE